VTHAGLLIVPALAQGIVRWYPGMEDYASARSYNGLTIVALNLAAAERVPSPRGGIAAGGVWFAVKRQQSTPDLRDDFGLVALETLGASGWRVAMPIRPRAPPGRRTGRC
jgi:hypothetical protein